ncbi:hypothetical protein PR048_017012 [Dryococelus australis]|uniref:Uncharacterized protein n=1 Tax=Dryococelus australis TaxID=614101 RepID=A0ABQ9H8D9_9NEOP|nr:hypothetical protein PR048_017012 [Dryococelus australis]
MSAGAVSRRIIVQLGRSNNLQAKVIEVIPHAIFARCYAQKFNSVLSCMSRFPNLAPTRRSYSSCLVKTVANLKNELKALYEHMLENPEDRGTYAINESHLKEKLGAKRTDGFDKTWSNVESECDAAMKRRRKGNCTQITA